MVPLNRYMRDISRMSGIPLTVLTSRTKKREVSRQRMAAMFVLVRKGGFLATDVAYRMSLDRTTVEYGIDAVENLLSRRDPDTIRQYKIAIRCWVRLARSERRYRAESAQYIESLERSRPGIFHRSKRNKAADADDSAPQGISEAA